MVINKAPYKLIKNDINIWSNVSYSKINLWNTQNINGAKASSTNIIFGMEYTPYQFLKFGFNIGYSKPSIVSNNILYKGNSDQYYYGVYSNINITKNLTTNIILGRLSSKYNLSRKPINLDVIHSNPKFYLTDVDILFLYKLKFNNCMITPYASLSYVNSNMSSYNENGFFVRTIYGSNYSELKSGIGVKALTVLPLEKNNVVIPSISLGLHNSLQKSKSTNIHTKIDNVPVEFYSDQNYGGLGASGIVNISYIFKNSVTLDFNVGTNINSKNSSYNLGLAINFLL